jgi:hypothetical protein
MKALKAIGLIILIIIGALGIVYICTELLLLPEWVSWICCGIFGVYMGTIIRKVTDHERPR